MASNRALVRLLTEMGVVLGADSQGEPILAEECLSHWSLKSGCFFRAAGMRGCCPKPRLLQRIAPQMLRFRAELAHWAAWRDGLGRRAFALPMAHGSDDTEWFQLDQLSMADGWTTRA